MSGTYVPSKKSAWNTTQKVLAIAMVGVLVTGGLFAVGVFNIQSNVDPNGADGIPFTSDDPNIPSGAGGVDVTAIDPLGWGYASTADYIIASRIGTGGVTYYGAYNTTKANWVVSWTSTNASSVFQNCIGNNIDIHFAAGTYNIPASLTISGLSNGTLSFAKGAVLNTSASIVNAPAILLNDAHNWVISGATVDCNLVAYVGIEVRGASTNNHVEHVVVYDAVHFGFYVFGIGSIHNGISYSKLYNCLWNGIQLGGAQMGICEQALYAIDNEVYKFSDVGISAIGFNSVIRGNYVHDGSLTQGSNNASTGIAVEGDGDAVITENTVNFVSIGIAILNGSAPSKVSYNNIGNCSTLASGGSNDKTGILSFTNGNEFSHNTIDDVDVGFFSNANLEVFDWNKINNTDNIAIEFDGTNCTASYNTIRNHGSTNDYDYAIALYGAFGTADNNNIEGTINLGGIIAAAAGCQILDNKINTAGAGIWTQSTGAVVSGNSLYNNGFNEHGSGTLFGNNLWQDGTYDASPP